MNIPRYWAKAEQTVRVGNKNFHLVAWKGSDEGVAVAQALAAADLAERIARKERGEKLGSYPRDGRPLREEIVEEIFGPEGNRVALITRNRAGCLVLNTAQVMFVDLDFANQNEGGSLVKALKQGLSALFRREPKTPQPPSPRTEEGLLHKVHQWHTQHSDWAIRVYRTRMGLRLLVAHDLYDPSAQSVQQAMNELGADLRYMRLCASQVCFRARLTPKPHRIKGGKMKPSGVSYPYASVQEERKQRAWEKTYHSRIENFAVCMVLANLGSSPVHPEAEQIIRLHDQYTLGDKPLA